MNLIEKWADYCVRHDILRCSDCFWFKNFSFHCFFPYSLLFIRFLKFYFKFFFYYLYAELKSFYAL